MKQNVLIFAVFLLYVYFYLFLFFNEFLFKGPFQRNIKGQYLNLISIMIWIHGHK